MAITKRHRIKKVAFGFLDTLVDLEAGLRKTLIEVLGPRRVDFDLDDMAAAWNKATWLAFNGPYVEFPELILGTLAEVCSAFDAPLREHDADDVDRWVPTWPMYEDHTALARLGARFKCALLSQVDKVTLSGCLPDLTRQPDYLATSDLSRAYPPAPAFFRLLPSQLRLAENENLLIISKQHEIDIAPAEPLGYQTLWVDTSGQSDGPSTLIEAVQLLG